MIVLRNVPVFRPGTWHAHEYSEGEVALMARAARWTGAPVVVRLGGHGPKYPEAGRASNFRVDEDSTLRCDLEVSEEGVARMREERLLQPSIGHRFTHEVCAEALHEVALVARGDVDLPPVPIPVLEDDETVPIGGSG